VAIGPFVTVEEHSVSGGLGDALADALSDLRSPTPLRRHGVHDEYVEIGPPAALYVYYHPDSPGVAGVTRKLLMQLAPRSTPVAPWYRSSSHLSGFYEWELSSEMGQKKGGAASLLAVEHPQIGKAPV
jgi:hypothetical protein